MTSTTEKSREVSSFLEQLRKDLDDGKLSVQERDSILGKLKVHGRVVAGAESIFTKSGIETLARYGFDQDVQSTSHEALRCLANALLLQPQCSQILVDLDYAPKAAERLKTENLDDEFLLSRILFLFTYGTKLDFKLLIQKHYLADAINHNIGRHSKRFSKSSETSPNLGGMDEMALSESLKLLFNITRHYETEASRFSQSIPYILKILSRIELPHPPYQGAVQYLVNALINLDLANTQTSHFAVNPLFPEFDPNCNVERLVDVLDRVITEYSEDKLDLMAAPVLTLIRQIYEIAPDGVQMRMKKLLLPSDEERSEPLGHSGSLSSRLLRLSTSALTPNIRGSISAMLFELSGKDAGQFIHNVGYGYASGFLLSNNIPMPEMQPESDGRGVAQGLPINPITGQRIDAEPEVTTTEMTEEEREREAERLFVLFERLRQTGVIDVVNPVEQAMREGRFEELDD